MMDIEILRTNNALTHSCLKIILEFL